MDEGAQTPLFLAKIRKVEAEAKGKDDKVEEAEKIVNALEQHGVKPLEEDLSAMGMEWLNAQNEVGKTKLMISCENPACEPITRALLEVGVDVTAKDEWGETALICAAK